MVTDEQIQEIRDHLEKSLNPLFFYDDDQDGLSSFLLLKRKYQKGRGIPAKTRSGDHEFYLRKMKEVDPDLIVFLDRPDVAQEVLDAAKCPVLWIDHHKPVKRLGVKYYNPMVATPGDNRSTSFWAYQVVQQDLWIALVGCIGDWQIPDFIKDFKQQELFNNKKTPPEIMFDSEFGKLIKVFNFIMKGSSTDIRKNISVLEKIQSPNEILKQESSKGKFLWKKFEQVNKEYETLLKKALEHIEEGDIFIFTYPTGKHSFSSGLSNELLHRVDKEMFIIARENDHEEMIASIRGKTVDVLPMLEKVLKSVNGHGGGHAKACGAVIAKEDFAKFVVAMQEEFAKLKTN
jgi:single-stranded DNA-specific DHH superfamily exonuclease